MKTISCVLILAILLGLLSNNIAAQNLVSLEMWSFEYKNELINRLKITKNNLDSEIKEAYLLDNDIAFAQLKGALSNVEQAIATAAKAARNDWPQAVQEVEAALNEYDLFSYGIYDQTFWQII
jgi:hypothetical protein